MAQLNNKRKEFDPAEQVEAILDFIKNYFIIFIKISKTIHLDSSPSQ